MFCSVCFLEFGQERDPFITCADCEDHFHYECLEPEVLDSFFKAMVDHVLWYCKNCVEDSDSTREELKKFVCSVPTYHQPPKKPMVEEETGEAQVVPNPLMEETVEAVDERRGSLVEKNRTAERTQEEVDEEKDTEKEVVQIEGEKEAVKEDEPKIQPGNADD